MLKRFLHGLSPININSFYSFVACLRQIYSCITSILKLILLLV